MFVGLGGIVVGVVVGFILTEGWRRTNDPTLEIMVSLLAPFAAYLPAEALGLSGVLAAVVAGLIAGRRAARVLSPDARLMGRAVWDIVTFIINSLAFMLIGLQLPSILAHLDLPGPTLIAYGLAISLIVIVTRIVWVFPATYLPRRLSKSIRSATRARHRRPSSSSPGRACAAPSRWPPPWPCRSTSGSRSATWSSS